MSFLEKSTWNQPIPQSLKLPDGETLPQKHLWVEGDRI